MLFLYRVMNISTVEAGSDVGFTGSSFSDKAIRMAFIRKVQLLQYVTMYLFPIFTDEPKCQGMYLLFIWVLSLLSFNTVQVISQRVVLCAEETSTYSWSRFYSVNCRLMASNYQLSHLRSGRDTNSDLRGGRGECYQSARIILYFLPGFCLNGKQFQMGSI